MSVQRSRLRFRAWSKFALSEHYLHGRRTQKDEVSNFRASGSADLCGIPLASRTTAKALICLTENQSFEKVPSKFQGHREEDRDRRESVQGGMREKYRLAGRLKGRTIVLVRLVSSFLVRLHFKDIYVNKLDLDFLLETVFQISASPIPVPHFKALRAHLPLSFVLTVCGFVIHYLRSLLRP